MTHVDLAQKDPVRANAQLSTGNFQAVALTTKAMTRNAITTVPPK